MTDKSEKPTIWQVQVSATVKFAGPNGQLIEAHVSIPIHEGWLSESIRDQLTATAMMPLPDGEEWGV